MRDIGGLSHDETAQRMGAARAPCERSASGRWRGCGTSRTWRNSRMACAGKNHARQGETCATVRDAPATAANTAGIPPDTGALPFARKHALSRVLGARSTGEGRPGRARVYRPGRRTRCSEHSALHALSPGVSTQFSARSRGSSRFGRPPAPPRHSPSPAPPPRLIPACRSTPVASDSPRPGD